MRQDSNERSGQIGPLPRAFPSEAIKTPRIALKRHEISLAETMFAYVDEDRVRLGEYLPWVEGTRTLEDEYGYIRMTRECWEKHELFDFGIFRAEEGHYLGNVGVHSISWEHRRCELGYWILGRFEGQGFVSEAVRALERVLFEMGFHRIEIHCSSSNLKSAAVPRRCGYRLEGVLRDASIESGKYRDTQVFAKLSTDAAGQTES